MPDVWHAGSRVVVAVRARSVGHLAQLDERSGCRVAPGHDEVGRFAVWGAVIEDSAAKYQSVLLVAILHSTVQRESPGCGRFKNAQLPAESMTHVALPRQEEPTRQTVVRDPAHLPTLAHPPVFLHCGWRTRGTWIWNRFRQMQGVAGYYEPLGEPLSGLRPGNLASITAESWASGHMGLDRPYFDEYRPLLRPGLPGVRGYQARFATADFFAAPDANLADLYDYLRGLLDASRTRGEQPVLKFCRSIGRVGWMRRHFPDAVHIVVLRDPFTQFASAARQFIDTGNVHFLGMPSRLLALHREQPMVNHCLRHLAVELPDPVACRTADAALAACEANLRNSTPAEWYRGFLAFWTATVAPLPDDVDLVIDSGALTRSRSYRRKCEDELARLTGRTVEFGDADDSGDTARPDAPLLRRSSFLRAHADAEAFLTEQRGVDWADTRVMGHVARLLTEARSHAFGARESRRAPRLETQDLLDLDPDFDSILLSAMGRAAWAERELAAMRGSRSWRMTALLRWLRQSLG